MTYDVYILACLLHRPSSNAEIIRRIHQYDPGVSWIEVNDGLSTLEKNGQIMRNGTRFELTKKGSREFAQELRIVSDLSNGLDDYCQNLTSSKN